MRIPAMRTYQDIILPSWSGAAPGRASSGQFTANRNFGPDTVRISDKALAKINALLGTGEPEMNDAGKLVAGQLQSWLDKAKETGSYEGTSEMLPMNHARLMAIEAEIAAGNESQELKDKRFMLLLFGDVRELTQQELDEGAALLADLMPSESEGPGFGDVVTLLRKAYGLGDGQSEENEEQNGANAEQAEKEKPSPETELLLEEVRQFLSESQGALVEITLDGTKKTTRITRGPDEDGQKSMRFNITHITADDALTQKNAPS